MTAQTVLHWTSPSLDPVQAPCLCFNLSSSHATVPFNSEGKGPPDRPSSRFAVNICTLKAEKIPFLQACTYLRTTTSLSDETSSWCSMGRKPAERPVETCPPRHRATQGDILIISCCIFLGDEEGTAEVERSHIKSVLRQCEMTRKTTGQPRMPLKLMQQEEFARDQTHAGRRHEESKLNCLAGCLKQQKKDRSRFTSPAHSRSRLLNTPLATRIPPSVATSFLLHMDPLFVFPVLTRSFEPHPGGCSVLAAAKGSSSFLDRCL